MTSPAFIIARRRKMARRVKIEVAFERVERAQSRGGWINLPPVHVEFTGWLTHSLTSLDPAENAQANSVIDLNRGWLLHVGPEVVLQFGPNHEDVFDIPGWGKFRVIDRRPFEWHGQITGYDYVLDKVT